MFGLDDILAAHLDGSAPLFALLLALALGLRHATDPDHLVALSTLAVGGEGGQRAGARLGFAWGLGHAMSLSVFGLPIVLFGSYLPDPLQRAAEVLVGLIIVTLAVRLLVRWRTERDLATVVRHRLDHGSADAHSHGFHEPTPHHHPTGIGRTARQACTIGVAHGAGGSAGVAVLLLAEIHDQTLAMAAFAVLALGTIASMTMISAGVGKVLGVVSLQRLMDIVPALAAASLGFGAWYALTAWFGQASLLLTMFVSTSLVAAFVVRYRRPRGPVAAPARSPQTPSRAPVPDTPDLHAIRADGRIG